MIWIDLYLNLTNSSEQCNHCITALCKNPALSIYQYLKSNQSPIELGLWVWPESQFGTTPSSQGEIPIMSFCGMPKVLWPFLFIYKCQRLVFPDIFFYGHVWLRTGPNSSDSVTRGLHKIEKKCARLLPVIVLYTRVSSSCYRSMTIIGFVQVISTVWHTVEMAPTVHGDHISGIKVWAYSETTLCKISMFGFWTIVQKTETPESQMNWVPRGWKSGPCLLVGYTGTCQ